jgi:hypothetical protein
MYFTLQSLKFDRYYYKIVVIYHKDIVVIIFINFSNLYVLLQKKSFLMRAKWANRGGYCNRLQSKVTVNKWLIEAVVLLVFVNQLKKQKKGKSPHGPGSKRGVLAFDGRTVASVWHSSRSMIPTQTATRAAFVRHSCRSIIPVQPATRAGPSPPACMHDFFLST